MKGPLPVWASSAFAVVFMVLAALAEWVMGRRLWGIRGEPGFWSGDIWSAQNSQYLLDPYALTHISHGIAFYAGLALVLKNQPLAVRFAAAVGLESLWEVIENTDAVINRYRAATVSLNYYGDSIANSMVDILACIAGFALASRLPPRVTALTFLFLEILLALWIRDNLSLNIWMLVHPSEAVRSWQLGK